MLRDLVEIFLVQLSEKFSAGDVEGVEDCLIMPAAIYFGNNIILLENREDVANFTESYMSEMRKKGLVKARLRLNEMTVSNAGLIKVIATAPMVDTTGTPIALGRTKYFLRQVGDTLKVEMAEHSQVPLELDLIHAPLAKLAV
jgi:hypothetical protein